MRGTESRENLVRDDESVLQTATEAELESAPEFALTPTEKKFLMCAERGDCATIRR
jgi:hypothetical protein